MGAEGTRSAANKWFDDTTYGTPAGRYELRAARVLPAEVVGAYRPEIIHGRSLRTSR